MKNRKTIITAFLLVAVMMLGVGYAALTDTLTIIGNAHIDIDEANKTFDERIEFTKAEAKKSTGSGSRADIASFNDDDATFTANRLAIKDEYSIFRFTITNSSNVDAKISIEGKKLSGDNNPTNSNEKKFKVDYKYYTSEDVEIEDLDNIIINSNGTIDVEVIVTVIQPVTAATSATFGIELTATSVDE